MDSAGKDFSGEGVKSEGSCPLRKDFSLEGDSSYWGGSAGSPGSKSSQSDPRHISHFFSFPFHFRQLSHQQLLCESLCQISAPQHM